ncbi:MAG: substrate-binding domain-containing protein [Phycisphaerae bacterium]|nr:substrate-binding domain-containing protein [Phycisphaerae bacterium]
MRSVIRSTAVGGRLPSVRQIMRNCSANKVVVDRALAKLQGEGIIESRPRSGFYRIGGVVTTRKTVDYLFFGVAEGIRNGTFHNEIATTLISVMARRERFLRIHILREEPNVSGIIEDLVSQSRPEVLLACVDLDNLYLAQWFVERKIPYLHVFPNLAQPVEPSVTLDDTNIVRQQIEYLVQLGHRSVAYLHAVQEEEFSRPADQRRDAFCRLAMEYRLPTRSHQVRYVGYEEKYVYRQTKELLLGDKRPTAMIIYDQHVKPVYAAIRSLGLTPGRDVSVIGCDDLPWTQYVDPPLTTIRVPRQRAAERICQTLDELVAGKPAGKKIIETDLIVRESTGPLSGKHKASP